MLGPVARISNQFARSLIKTPVRNAHAGGIPGENLPFYIHSRTRITVTFFLYVLSGFVPPFLIVLHQLRKK